MATAQSFGGYKATSPPIGAPSTTSMGDFLRPVPLRSNLAPSASYAVLVKVVLKRRLRNIFVLSGLAAYFALLLVVFDPKALPGSLVNFLPALFYTAFVFLGALPVFVLRKQTLLTAQPNYPSRFAHLLALRKPTTIPIFLAYLIGSVPLSLAYLWCADSVSRNAKLGILFYSAERDSMQLNERRIFLSLLHLFLVGFATLEHHFSSRSTVHFDEDSSLPIPARLKFAALARIAPLIRSVLLSNAVFYSIYLVLRAPVKGFLYRHVIVSWSKPYLYSLYHENALLSITLASRALASSFLTLVVWETAHTLFDVYVTQPMLVSHFAPNPNQCLLSGLRSEDPYFRHFAFLELSLLAANDPIRRKAIFIDIRPDSSNGGAWSDMSRECLKMIGTELQRVKRRGKIVTTTTTATTPSSTQGEVKSTLSSPRPMAPVRTDNVFQPTRKTLFDNLANSLESPTPPSLPLPLIPVLPIPIPTAITSSTTALATKANTLVSRVPIPSIFQSASSSLQAQSNLAVTLPARAEVIELEERLGDWVPMRFRGLLYRDLFGRRVERTVGVCLSGKREVVWAVRSLSHLLRASLNEDPYGVVQNDIPRILEAFILYLVALENLTKELTDDVGVSGKELEREEMLGEIAKQILPVQGALRDSLAEVLEEFSPYLSGFKFPPKIAQRLQLLVDWG